MDTVSLCGPAETRLSGSARGVDWVPSSHISQKAEPPEPFAVSPTNWRRGSVRVGGSGADWRILSATTPFHAATGARLSICTVIVRKVGNTPLPGDVVGCAFV